MSERSMSRRDFTRLAAAATAASTLPIGRSADGAPAPMLSDVTPAWPGYNDAMVIDCLANVTYFNSPDQYVKPLSPDMVENARKSGITAVNATCSGGGVGAPAFIQTVQNIAYYERELVAHPDALMKIRTVADLKEAKRSGRVGIILGFQDAVMLDADVSRVDLFHSLGVRIIQLTYNVRNLLGDGCLEPANSGLSTFGRRVIERMNDVGMLVDLGHVGRQTSADAVKASKKPVAATHTGCAALNDVPRNKPDALLKSIADTGGVVGIYLMPFLRTGSAPNADDVVKHISHAVDVCGEDHVGIGSDLSITPLDITPEFRAKHVQFVQGRRKAGIMAPGEDESVFNYVADFNQPRRMELIADALAKAGHGSARIAKIIGGNWERVFGEVWK
ncbi:MAG: membrane dipeptidase [Gemmatimonadaceae bacterium]